MDKKSLDEVRSTLEEVAADLEQYAAGPVTAGVTRDHGELREALQDEYQGLESAVGGLLDQARDARDTPWAPLRDALLRELKQAFLPIRESFEVLHRAIVDDLPSTDLLELADRLRSVEAAMYWGERRAGDQA